MLQFGCIMQHNNTSGKIGKRSQFRALTIFYEFDRVHRQELKKITVLF
jgi:hypothetical protein